jgi:hypothetical protein
VRGYLEQLTRHRVLGRRARGKYGPGLRWKRWTRTEPKTRKDGGNALSFREKQAERLADTQRKNQHIAELIKRRRVQGWWS